MACGAQDMVDANVQWRRGHGKVESRKDKVVEGWGRSSRQTRVKTGWSIGYEGGQGTGQKTRLTARWREGRVEIKPNGMRG